MLNPDLRIKTIASYIHENKKIVDVGTDHGHLPIYIALNKNAKSIIACDINKKPLMKATKNIIKYGLKPKIKILLSDGLDKISEIEVDQIIIAGMGGELISNIISKCSFREKKEFILQPMSKVEYLRSFLHDINFEIISETPIHHKNFIYSIIYTKYNKNIQYEKDEIYLHLGKNICNSNISKNYYIDEKIKKLNNILEKLKNSYNQTEKIEKIQNIISKLKKEKT